MRAILSKSLRAFAAAAAVGLALSDCPGQARTGQRFGTVGLIRSPGDSAASRTFKAYSYGVGGLAGPKPGAGGTVLSSSLKGGGGFALRRSGAGGTGRGMGAPLGPVQVSRRIYTPGESKRTPMGGSGIAQALRSRKTAGFGAASAYMAAFGAGSQTTLQTADQTITSLVPSEPSQYATYLEEGEKAFKEGEFEEAYRQFKLANHIGMKDPESLLSLAHAAFAKSTYGYAEAGLYLRRSLKYLPELPLVSMKPRAFYGETPGAINRYTTRIMRLEDHIARSPFDIDALLLLGYFKWFDGQYDLARQTLKGASDLLKKSTDKDRIEAVGIFLDGIAASGKVPPEKQSAPAGDGKPESLAPPGAKS